MKNKVKIMGPKFNATEVIDISDFKLNNRFYGTHRDEVVFDKKYPSVNTLLHPDVEYAQKEKEFLKIVSTSKHYKIRKNRFPYHAYPVVNVLIPDIFNHNNGEHIHCNACVRGLEVYETSCNSKHCYLRLKLTILDYTDTEMKNDIDTIQVMDEPYFWEDGILSK